MKGFRLVPPSLPRPVLFLGFLLGLLTPVSLAAGEKDLRELLASARPPMDLPGPEGRPARIGIAPLKAPEKSKTLAQVTGLWITAQLVQAGGRLVFSPDKVKGALSKAGYHVDELSDKELAAAARSLLDLDYLVQGEIGQEGKRRTLSTVLWVLPSMESRDFIKLSLPWGFQDFKKGLLRELLSDFPIEAPVEFDEDEQGRPRKLRVLLGWNQGLEEGSELLLYRPSRLYGGAVVLGLLRVSLVDSASSQVSVVKWLAPGVRPRAEEGDKARLIR